MVENMSRAFSSASMLCHGKIPVSMLLASLSYPRMLDCNAPVCSINTHHPLKQNSIIES